MIRREDEVQLCRALLRAFGIRLRIVSDSRQMPATKRMFDDVCMQKRMLWINQSNPDFYESLWHEVGHAIAADEQSRAGVNWCKPFPTHLSRVEIAAYRDFRLEMEACEATASALILCGVARDRALEVLNYVDAGDSVNNTDWCPRIVAATGLYLTAFARQR